MGGTKFIRRRTGGSWRTVLVGEDGGYAAPARLGLTMVGLAAALYILDTWSAFLIPVGLSLVIGLMLTPLVVRLENRGIAPAVIAAGTLLGLGGLLYLAALLFMVPLGEWFARAPEISAELRVRLLELRQSLSVLYEVEERLQEAAGNGQAAPQVEVSEGGIVGSVLRIAPPAIGQIVLFTGSLFFYLATRRGLRIGVLSVWRGQRAKLRAARILRDTERDISRYLLTISLVNVCLGIATGLSMWALGMPTPAFWGGLAALFNFIPYLGPWTLGAILVAVSLVSFDTWAQIVAPPLAFLVLNIIESQLVTPSLLGRSLTLNPLLVFLALGFWLYLWGPVGAFLAVPFLIIGAAAFDRFRPAAARRGRNEDPRMQVVETPPERAGPADEARTGTGP